MPPFEILLIVALGAIAAVGSLGLFLALRGEGTSEALEALERGDFEQAIALAADDAREVSTLAAATAARHLLQWEDAEAGLRRVLEGDPGHGEALIELGLVQLYRAELDGADKTLVEALGHRADLLESITLHRAVAAVLAGDTTRGHLLFEEVEAALETKLSLDVGEGEPAFAEWFLHSAVVWASLGRRKKAAWAWRAALDAAPRSRLAAHLQSAFDVADPSLGPAEPPSPGSSPPST